MVTADFASGTETQLNSNWAPVQCFVATAIWQQDTDFTEMFTDCTFVCVPQAAHTSQICSLLYSCILASTSAKACLSADVPSVTPSVLKSKGFCPQAALSSCMHSCLRHDLWVIACIAATPYILHTANTCSIWMLAEPQIWMLQRLEL